MSGLTDVEVVVVVTLTVEVGVGILRHKQAVEILAAAKPASTLGKTTSAFGSRLLLPEVGFATTVPLHVDMVVVGLKRCQWVAGRGSSEWTHAVTVLVVTVTETEVEVVVSCSYVQSGSDWGIWAMSIMSYHLSSCCCWARGDGLNSEVA